MTTDGITKCGEPIAFHGYQDGEIAVSLATASSPNHPWHGGMALVVTALGSLASARDTADPAKGENLCYVAALPVDKAVGFAGRVIGAVSAAIDSPGGSKADRGRLLVEMVPEALRAEMRDQLTAHLDAPRLAARRGKSWKEIAVDYSVGVALVETTADEYGVIDSDFLSLPVCFMDQPGAMADWYRDEAEARAAYRAEVGAVECELCRRFIDRADADIDEEGIYTCPEGTGCNVETPTEGATP